MFVGQQMNVVVDEMGKRSQRYAKTVFHTDI